MYVGTGIGQNLASSAPWGSNQLRELGFHLKRLLVRGGLRLYKVVRIFNFCTTVGSGENLLPLPDSFPSATLFRVHVALDVGTTLEGLRLNFSR